MSDDRDMSPQADLRVEVARLRRGRDLWRTQALDRIAQLEAAEARLAAVAELCDEAIAAGHAGNPGGVVFVAAVRAAMAVPTEGQS